MAGEETGTQTQTEGTQTAAAAAVADGKSDAGKADNQLDAKGKGTEGSADANADAGPFAELDPENREWVGKANVKDIKSLGKLAHEQAKRLGNSITLPGKNATPEEISAFNEKMGIPATADGYDLKVPEKLPESLPYDAEKATSFKTVAKEAGLSKAQAAKLHDWFVDNAVQEFNGSAEAAVSRAVEKGKAETAKLEKLWGPLSGETMKANMEFADKALGVGGQAVVDALTEAKLIGQVGGTKVVQNADVAQWLAKVGMSLFKEDSIPAGGALTAKLGNPFAEGESFNLTQAMQIVKKDRDLALSLITAAGKKPEDFGLKA